MVLLRCIAEAVVENGLRGLAEMIPGGAYAFEVGRRALEKYRERCRDDRLQAEIEKLAQTPTPAAREEAVQATQEALAQAGQSASPEDVIRLEQYLAAVPDAVRASLKRPDDPSGKSVPARLTVNTPDDLLRFLPARPPRFAPGAAFPGKPGWILTQLLGMGGFGEVWRAQHGVSSNLTGAVKFCLGQSGEQLIHEAALIDRVMQVGRHPNIVPLVDVNLTGDTPWLMFEYVAGGTLTDWIHQLARKPTDQRVKQVIAALQQLLDAVGTFHALRPPLVHRDLKPSNILLDKASKKLRITDFGIGAITATAANQQESRGQTSRAGRMISSLRGSFTPIYSSPQQRAGGEPDPRDDVHALGVIAYQMLTGDLAQGPGPDFADELRDLGLGDDLITLLGRCVAKRVETRPASAVELRRLWTAATMPKPEPISLPAPKPVAEIAPPLPSPPPSPPQPEYPVAIPVQPPPPRPTEPVRQVALPVQPPPPAPREPEECTAIKDATVRDWCRQAHAGAVIAMYNMGVMYRDGDKIPRNYPRAIEWFQRAADQNYVEAMNNLGLMYCNGQGVPVNYARARQLFRQAADSGHILAMRNLGLMYRDGEGGPIDYRQAIEWFRKAADGGESGSMFNLGLMYNTGQGVPVDHGQAFQWYRKAADLGYPDAAYNVAWDYDNGKGVTLDYREALRWYKKAADLGFSLAMLNLGVMYQNGKGVPVDCSQALTWYRKAADAGVGLAMYNLARLYETGQGTARDRKAALDWYRRALAAGEDRAREAIQRLS
ncbi:MAG: serine/threonine-protein kinase [Gemmataceae bacterium]